MTEDDGGRTVACRLHPILRAPLPSNDVIEDAVQRVHRTVLHASEAIALLVQEDIEANVAQDALLPLGEHGMVDAMFRAVVSGRQGSRDDTPHRAAQLRVLGAFRRIHGNDATLVDGAGLGQLLKYESRFWIAALKTGLCVHFRKRVHRYCKLRLRLTNAQYDALDADGRKAHTKRVLTATTDVCRPGWQAACAEARDAPFVHAMRAVLRLSSMDWAPVDKRGVAQKKTLTDLIKAQPQHFLPGMSMLNRAFAEAGERTFRLVPMRTSLAPKFVHVCQQVVKDLALVDDDQRKQLGRDARQRCQAQAPFKKHLQDARARHAAERAEWKQADLERNAHLQKGQKRKKPPDDEVHRREERQQAMVGELKAIEDDPSFVALRAGAAAEKDDAMNAVFDVTSVLSKKHALLWMGSLKTDGVSARLLVARPGDEEGKDGGGGRSGRSGGGGTDGKKRDREGRRRLPLRGLLSVDELSKCVLGGDAPKPVLAPTALAELAGLSPRGQNVVLNEALEAAHGGRLPFSVVGLDPGKHELAVLSDPDFEPATRRMAIEAELAPRRTRYTQPQRRQAMRPARFFLKPKHANDPEKQRRAAAARAYRHAHVYTPPDVLDAEHSLADHNSKGPTAARLMAYCRARSAALPALLSYHTHPMRRHLRWKAFIEEQRSFSNFCDCIRQTFGGGMRQPGEDARDTRPVVLAYGAWGLSTAAPAKGLPPCIGKGLLKKLSREFVVVTVPEHFTSKRCFHCGGECGNHAYLAERDRRAGSDARLEKRLDERLARSETPAQRTTARAWFDRALSRPCEIRGLRFCSDCKRCLNRDANSAPQMAVQLKRLVLGAGPLHRVSREDAAMQEMSNAIEG